MARSLYERAGFDVEVAANPIALCEALLGAGCVEALHASSLPGDGMLTFDGEHWTIVVRAKLSGYRLRFVVLHELAHWVLGPGATEDECDALAAALLVPRLVFLDALKECGQDLASLARRLNVTESFAALRLGEVTGEPVALITPTRVRVRGEDWGWPHEEALRQAALLVGPGLRKVPITDEYKRVVLRAGELDG